MTKFEVKIQVSLSTVIEVEANSEDEAMLQAENLYYEDNLLGDIRFSEYYDGVKITVIDSDRIGEK